MNPRFKTQLAQSAPQLDAQTNPQEQALLQQLKDVALPADPGWWPPGPGWWVVLFVLIAVMITLWWFIQKSMAKKSRNAWRRSALDEHQRLHQMAVSGEDQTAAIAQLSVLMRRVALAVEPRSKIASLTDEEWLTKLDAIGHTTGYTNGAGSVLYRHQYQSERQLDDEAVKSLFRLTAETIRSASPDIHSSEGRSVAAI